MTVSTVFTLKMFSQQAVINQKQQYCSVKELSKKWLLYSQHVSKKKIPFYWDNRDTMDFTGTCMRTTDFTLQFFALFSSPDQQIQNFFFAPTCFKTLQKEIQKIYTQHQIHLSGFTYE